MAKVKSEQSNTLDFLLEVESKASVLVKEAQEEADKRIRDFEEASRKAYEERCRTEIQTQETLLADYNEKVKNDYVQILQDYRQEISKITENKERFSALLNEYLVAG